MILSSILALLAGASFAQNFSVEMRLADLEKEMRELQMGRPTYLSRPIHEAEEVHKSTVNLLGPLVGPQIVQAWAHFTGTGTYAIMDGVGITSITSLATGDYRINFSTPFLNINYAASCLSSMGGMFCAGGVAEIRAVSADRVRIFDAAGVAQDSNRVSYMAVGRR